jgi:hypothetical protein
MLLLWIEDGYQVLWKEYRLVCSINMEESLSQSGLWKDSNWDILECW